MTALTAAQVRRRYLVLHGLRWLPTGLAIPVITLLMLERGLTLSQVGWVAAVLGTAAFALETPTGGLADALGRRPVLITSKTVHIGSMLLLAFADSFPLFLVGGALHGIFRALDSGPLDAWYVDTTLEADPRAEIVGGLSGGGVVLGAAVATGALASSGLVLLDPVPAIGALPFPLLVAAALDVAGVAAVALLVTEARRPGVRRAGLTAIRASVADVPGVIGDALRLARRSRILLALMVAELLWAFGSVAFETLTPPRIAEIVGSEQSAAAIMGPAGATAWVASAIGASLAPFTSRLVGVPIATALLRVAQGGTVVAMGVLAGPVGVVAAYVGTYVIHGAANPLHQTLLHRQVDGPYRATVLSLNSMMSQPGLVIGSIALTALADATSISVAMAAGAAVIAAAAPLYLTARRPAAAAPAPSAATVGQP